MGNDRLNIDWSLTDGNLPERKEMQHDTNHRSVSCLKEVINSCRLIYTVQFEAAGRFAYLPTQQIKTPVLYPCSILTTPKQKWNKRNTILHELYPYFLTELLQFRPFSKNNSKANIKRIHGREKVQYKKKKKTNWYNQKCSNKECYHVFSFFHHMRLTFFLFIFLFVSNCVL